MEVVPFDLKKLPFAKRNFIEANAGTGKTYHLIKIYAYYINDHAPSLSPADILTLSFTNNAVEEIKIRIRKEIKSNLSKKINFSKNEIYTFHGFCHKLLSDYNLETLEAFNKTIDDALEDEIFKEAFSKFYRKFFLKEDELFLNHLTKGKHLKKLFIFLKEVFKRLDLVFYPLVTKKKNYQDLKSSYESQRDDLKKIINADYQGLEWELLSLKLKNKNKHRNIAEKFKYLKDYFNHRFSFSLAPCYKGKEDENNYLLTFFSLARIEQYLSEEANPLSEKLISFLKKLAIYQKTLELLLSDLANNFFYYCQLGIGEIETSSQEIKDAKKILTYNDLIKKMNLLLNNQDFLKIVSQKYQVLLVDEFQDTDSVQFKLINSLLQHNAKIKAYFIGDPKQAIYGYRNANLNTYLQARNKAGKVYTLTENHRSQKKLIQAINYLYENQENPFLEANIAYHPSTLSEASNEGLQPPLVIKDIKKNNHKTPELKNKIIENLAQEINQLPEEERGQSCILVRKNKDVKMIAEALSKWGLKISLFSDDELNKSSLAREVLLLLNGFLHHGSEEQVRAALTTSFFNYSLNELKDLTLNDFNNVAKVFSEYFFIWQKQGVYLALFSFIKNPNKNEFLKNVLLKKKDEDEFFRLLDLMDYLQGLEKEAGSSPEVLLENYKNKFILSEENHPLRKDVASHFDQPAVKIMTVHKSKGLEFDNVFLPFASIDSWNFTKNSIIFFERDEGLDSGGNYYLDLGSDEKEINKHKSQEELRKEEMRIFYVALTRAKKKLFLYYDAANSKNQANALIDLKKIKDNPDFKVETFWLDEKVASPVENKLVSKTTRSLTLNRLTSPLTSEGYLTSYSSISSDINDLDFNDVHFFHPHFTKKKTSSTIENSSSVNSPISTLQSLPLGSNTGKCLHKILEQWDGGKDEKFNFLLIKEQLKNFQMNEELNPVISKFLKGLNSIQLKTNQATLEINFRKLDQTNQWMKEMEFYLPVKKTRKEMIEHFLALLHKNNYLLDKYVHQTTIINPSINELTIEKGFLKGFVDLIFKSNGKYYLIDWKTNFLGPRKEDYGAQSIKNYLLEKNYFLQGFIYTLALDAYLMKRLKDGYSYEESFGGVFYIFLRGFEPAKKEENGYYFFKFDHELIRYFRTNFIE